MGSGQESIFRVVFIAPENYVGISCIFKRMRDGSYPEISPATISFDYFSMKVKESNGGIVNLQFFDNPYNKFIKYRGCSLIKRADLIVVAYSCTDRSSFEDVPAIMKRISEGNGKKFEDRSILISTMCDVDQERKKVTEEEARSLQRQ